MGRSHHEAKAEVVLILQAEALTHFSLEAEALVNKLKPGYLNSTNVSWIRIQHLESEALLNHEVEVFENHEAKAEARLPKI